MLDDLKKQREELSKKLLEACQNDEDMQPIMDNIRIVNEAIKQVKKEPVESKVYHERNISELLDNMKTARILAGAEMGALCNEGEYKKAQLFQIVRDVLATHIKVIEESALF